MADTISALLANMEQYQYQPALIQQDILDHLDQVTAGAVQIVDPSNPFVFGLEAATVLTAGFMAKDQVRSRMQYASMAQNPADLFNHMSDWDYVDLFAKPSVATIGFAFSLIEITAKLVTDPATGIKKLVIPRNSTVTVADTVFSLQYPIEIRQMLHGGLQIVFDGSQVSPLQTLTTNVIQWEVRNVAGEDMIFFELPMMQMKVTPRDKPITKAAAFELSFKLTDQYYYTRVWAQQSDNTWRELVTTMSPEVYDVTKPTAVISVAEGQVTVKIPQIYAISGQLSGKIRCDFYETKGPLNMDLEAYPQNAFIGNWYAIDTNDRTVFVAPMGTLSTQILMGGSRTLGGNDALSFEAQRERVINNATGQINLPITPAQIEAKLTRNGYEIVQNIDNITNRVFLATKPMPTPTNAQLISAAAASIETVTTSMTDLAGLPSVVDNGQSMTLTPDTLYKNVRGVVQLAPAAELAALQALPPAQRALAVNSQQYYYSPFHYVMEATGVEFDFRPYYLDSPNVVTTVHVGVNDSTLLQVSTRSYNLLRTTSGYTLRIVESSSSDWQALTDDQVFVQLGFIPEGEQDRAYMNGRFVGLDPTTGERVWDFDLSTTYHIDANDAMEFVAFTLYTTDARIVKAPLTTQFELVYSTSKVMDTQWRTNDVDKFLGKWLLPADIKGVTHEQIRLHFGDALRALWARARSVVGDLPYKTYTMDIPAFYKEDVYKADANGGYVQFGADGVPFVEYLHNKGDPVLDDAGNQVYEHRAGDVMVDGDGKPIPGGNRDLLRQLDITMLEGCYYFATDSVARGYRSELVQTLLAWLLGELEPISDVLLDQTKIFFYPKSTLGYIQVINQNGVKVNIQAGQSFVVNLYVTEQVYKNTDLRKKLERTTVSQLNQAVDAITVAQSGMSEQLRQLYGEDVVDVQLTGLGGNNLPVFTVADSSTRCGLKKILVAQGDDSLIVQEDVTVVWTQLKTA